MKSLTRLKAAKRALLLLLVYLLVCISVYSCPFFSCQRAALALEEWGTYHTVGRPKVWNEVDDVKGLSRRYRAMALKES